MLKRTYSLVMFTLLTFSISLNAEIVNTGESLQFISKYKDIAVREMHRTGIPASITLAQAIHESSWGRGTLAVHSNNYFGIKCKAEWTGATYYKEDDDYVDGELVKSCFRNYPSIEASYIDHSNFLKDNARYGMLFGLNEKDYIGWAKGLQSCGYATDPQYANKLIRTIEKYQLYEYDFIEVEEPVLLDSEPAATPVLAGNRLPVIGQSTVSNENEWTAQEEPAVASAPDVYEATVVLEVPDAYRIPDNYVRNSYRKSHPIQPKMSDVEVSDESSVVASNTTEEQGWTSNANHNEVEESFSADVYEEKRGRLNTSTHLRTAASHSLVHSPVRYNGTERRTAITRRQAQNSQTQNSSIKNRRLPRVQHIRK